MNACAPAPWEALTARLRPFIARRVSGEADVDDVLQEVLLRMHRGLPALGDTERLPAWMYAVARSAIADHGRARARHPLAAAAPAEAVAPADEDDDVVAAELARSLSYFVALLPSPYREAVTLTELEGLTQKQAAEMLGLSLSGMKSRVQRGRAKLRAMLEACCAIALDARGRVVACEPRPLGDVPEDCCGS